MSPIGGYFEFELGAGNSVFHDTIVTTQSGRGALQYILESVRPALVYIPFFTCKVVTEPFHALGIPYKYYRVDASLRPEPVTLKENELFLYINYLDLKREIVEELADVYGDKLIADCTGAFFMKGNGKYWLFNSCRKFFGVPDGAYLYAPKGQELQPVKEENTNFLTDHLLKRYAGDAEAGYETFLRNEVVVGSGVMAMSRLSRTLMSYIDYDFVARKRRENYDYLRSRLQSINEFAEENPVNNVPQYYPLVLSDGEMRLKLIKNKIFISVIWPHIHNSLPGDAFEHYLASHLLPLPIDHRYGAEEMERMVAVIFSLI